MKIVGRRKKEGEHGERWQNIYLAGELFVLLQEPVLPSEGGVAGVAVWHGSEDIVRHPWHSELLGVAS